ncbi:hypothetical protein CUMW_284550 [Citrus unshiu]|uniref:Uncharacterized protein n=1 Tax=Citrus unshiu TaxID=55188 RepID=A0A2H5N4D9_CITUN|nr:hypothetical protein CUMW_284550 [Citrus unshiu]
MVYNNRGILNAHLSLNLLNLFSLMENCRNFPRYNQIVQLSSVCGVLCQTLPQRWRSFGGLAFDVWFGCFRDDEPGISSLCFILRYRKINVCAINVP